MKNAEKDSTPSFYFNRAKDAVGSESTQHYHNTFEIYYMKEGTCSYFIDSKAYEVCPGDLILIPEGVIHKTNYSDKPHTRLLINCTEDYIPSSVYPFLSDIGYLYRNDDAIKKIEEVLLKIEEEYKIGDEISKEATRCYAEELFFLIGRNRNQSRSIESIHSLVEISAEYIKENYQSEISLSEIAKILSVSPEHLSRSFKKETGFGFCEYLTLMRLKAAEQMLRNEPGKSISEVAYSVGFNDSNYFSVKFKKLYGISPSKLKTE